MGLFGKMFGKESPKQAAPANVPPLHQALGELSVLQSETDPASKKRVADIMSISLNCTGCRKPFQLKAGVKLEPPESLTLSCPHCGKGLAAVHPS